MMKASQPGAAWSLRRQREGDRAQQLRRKQQKQRGAEHHHRAFGIDHGPGRE